MARKLSFLTDEEEAAFETALKIIGRRRRIMVTIVPEEASEELCMRLTTWTGFILDTGLLPPIPVPAIQSANQLICPYCGVAIQPQFPKHFKSHTPECKWRVAIMRWAEANVGIDEAMKHE